MASLKGQYVVSHSGLGYSGLSGVSHFSSTERYYSRQIEQISKQARSSVAYLSRLQKRLRALLGINQVFFFLYGISSGKCACNLDIFRKVCKKSLFIRWAPHKDARHPLNHATSVNRAHAVHIYQFLLLLFFFLLPSRMAHTVFSLTSMMRSHLVSFRRRLFTFTAHLELITHTARALRHCRAAPPPRLVSLTRRYTIGNFLPTHIYSIDYFEMHHHV